MMISAVTVIVTPAHGASEHPADSETSTPSHSGWHGRSLPAGRAGHDLSESSESGPQPTRRSIMSWPGRAAAAAD